MCLILWWQLSINVFFFLLLVDFHIIKHFYSEKLLAISFLFNFCSFECYDICWKTMDFKIYSLIEINLQSNFCIHENKTEQINTIINALF